LLRLDPASDEFLTEASQIAEAWVPEPKGGGGNDRYFLPAAQDLLTALIMHECRMAKRTGGVPTLGGVRRMATAEYVEAERDPKTGGKLEPTGLLKHIVDMLADNFGPVVQKAQRFMNVSKGNLEVVNSLCVETGV